MSTTEFLLLALAVIAVGAVLLWEDRRRASDLRRLRRLVAERERAASLFLRDLNAAGLALLGQAQTLPEARPLEASVRRILLLADDAADTLIEHDRPRSLREARFPLGEFLREALSQAEVELAPGRRNWRVDAALEDMTVTADRRALRAAVLEVLGRAARATREGDWVDIRLERRGDSVALIIEDEGMGLAAEDLSPSAEAGRERGLGLGLALARSLLRAHGGDLAMEAAPGVGSRAYLTLPSARLRPA
jgi:signal transduction histidine kinase